MSVPRALLIVLALLQATGLAEAMRRQVCAAACRDDGCGDDCTPDRDAPSCSCHCPGLQTHVPPQITAVAIVPGMQTAAQLDPGDEIHPSPDPREISHVPRHAV